jgi:vitamin B12 transporter
LLHDRLKFGVTYFYTHLQRTINFTGFSVDPLGLGRFSGYENGPGGLSRGFETYAEVNPLHGMNLSGTYTFTNSERRSSGTGLLAEYVIPKNLFGVALTQSVRRFRFSANFDYTGSYIAPVFENDFPFRTANLRFHGYTKVDLQASYRHALGEKRQLIFFGGSQNLFDQRYFENGYLAPGITVNGGVKVEF